MQYDREKWWFHFLNAHSELIFAGLIYPELDIFTLSSGYPLCALKKQ